MIEKHRSVAGDLAVAGSIGGRASAIRRKSSLSVAGRRRRRPPRPRLPRAPPEGDAFSAYAPELAGCASRRARASPRSRTSCARPRVPPRRN